MIAALVSTIQHWATQFGGIGMFVIAALDSSFLSFPQINDLLIIAASTTSPGLMPYYAGMSVLGSLVGCLALFLVARRGGENMLRKRFKGKQVDRALALYQRFGLLAVIVPSLMPPPVPFKVFVLLAGAAGVSPLKFSLAILFGRGTRYFGQGYLAVVYGDHAADVMKQYGAEIGLGLALAVVVIAVVVIGLRRKK